MHDYSTRPHHKLASLSLQAWFLFAVLGDSGISRGDWPQWRGPLGTGVSPNSIPPTHWDEARNILWKTKIEGEGHGTLSSHAD